MQAWEAELQARDAEMHAREAEEVEAAAAIAAAAIAAAEKEAQVEKALLATQLQAMQQQQAQQQGISAGLDQQVKRNSLAEYASLQKAIADMEKMPDGPQRDAAMEGIAARQSRSLPDKSQSR